MSWAVTASVSEFSEALDWFESKLPVTQDQLDTLDDVARARAFTIAGALEIETVQTVFDEIAKAIKEGTTLEEFQGAIEEKLLGKMGPSGHHLETVFINSTQQAYNSGRWVQMNDPAVNALRPFRMFDATVDDHTTQHCKDWDGVVRAWDDPCWLAHCPQCHHRCRSQLRSLRPKEAARRGLTETLPESQADSGFGLPPNLRDDSILRPKVERFDPEVWQIFESREFQAHLDLELEKERVSELRKKRDADNNNS